MAGLRVRIFGALVASAAAFAVTAGSASASTAAITTNDFFTSLTYTAAAGETNDLSAVTTCSPQCNTTTVTDPGADITPGSGCSQGADSHTVVCSATFALDASLGDMNDTLEAPDGALIGCDVCDGGAGNDHMHASAGAGLLGASEVLGGEGNDTLYDGSPFARMYGGPGDDKVIVQTGCGTIGDSVDGASGSGVDTVTYRQQSAGVTAQIGAGGQIAGNSCVESISSEIDNLVGGSGDDTLTGDAKANLLRGGRGDDVLTGQGGDDQLVGRGGEDALYGGSGTDTLDGGANPDFLDGGTGAGDTVTYASRKQGVQVSIGDGPNDGSSVDGASRTLRDNVLGDVENVIGGRGDDRLVGDDIGNVLTGGLGVDKLLGLGGGDTLIANDGVRDQKIDCGNGNNDSAEFDHGLDPKPVSC